MSRPVSNLRMFVAAYPPPPTQAALLEALRAIDLPPHRMTPVEQVHMTVQFIGDVAARAIDPVCESVERSVAGIDAFVLRPLRLITLPQRAPTRLIAVETDTPAALLEIQRRLAHRLARNPRDRADDHFLPHITLARFSAPSATTAVATPIATAPFVVGAISLMRSVLAPDGARHTEVRRVSLGAG